MPDGVRHEKAQVHSGDTLQSCAMLPARTGIVDLPPTVDIAIITILPQEYAAVQRRLKNVHRDPGHDQPNQYAWMVGEVDAAQGGTYLVALAMAGHPGNTSGSLAVSETIKRWSPRYVFLVGIAGGLPRDGVELGDVVVSKQICSYEYGKIHHNAFNPRPDFTYQVDGPLLWSAFSIDKGWRKGLVRRPTADGRRPEVRMGMMGSGDKVIDDRTADFFAAVEKVFPKLLAIDMEGAGAAAAIQQAQEGGRTVSFLMIRGISDMPPDKTSSKSAKGPSKKPSEGSVRDQWTTYAADVAASFTIHLISHALPRPPMEGTNLSKGEALGPVAPTRAERAKAKDRYFAYLRSECSEIQLAGLPADQHVGSRTLRLEQLFVPLHVETIESAKNPGFTAASGSTAAAPRSAKKQSQQRRSFGRVFAKEPRLALLARSGGGKSTLLKRVAMAYAFPERREELNDSLPDRVWLPVIIRCRAVGMEVGFSILSILRGLRDPAELHDLRHAFEALIDHAIDEGSLLLLVDGLDEIASDGQRTSFVQQLHTFLSLHPKVAMVVTSREAGFQMVAGTVAKACQVYRISEFSDKDITRLTVAWHCALLGDRPSVIKEARRLAQSITTTDRVRPLARNPLLLTTLLLVNRWVGELPAGRSALYEKAIEVLLMTWNVEAHQRMERNEVVPQLAFLAFTMMQEGVRQVSQQRLREVLFDARRQMEDLLAYTRDSVDELIRRVEHRSDLLVQAGHVNEYGRIWPVYEFRHLTFQEYLAALAAVDGNYPGHREGDTVLSALEPHILSPEWKEVVPLAAVLAGRKARGLVEHLVTLCEEKADEEMGVGSDEWTDEDRADARDWTGVSVLTRCLIDGVPLPTSLVERALLAVARLHDHPDNDGEHPLDVLMNSRYDKTLLKVVIDAWVGDIPGSISMYGAMNWIASQRWWHSVDQMETIAEIREALASGDAGRQALATKTLQVAAFVGVDYGLAPGIDQDEELVRALADLSLALGPLLKDPRRCLHIPAVLAYAWLCERKLVSERFTRSVLPRLLELWRFPTEADVQRLATWSIAMSPLLDRERTPLPVPDASLSEWFLGQYDCESAQGIPVWRGAALTLAYYWKQPWSDDEIARRIPTVSMNAAWQRRMLQALGRTD